MTILLPSLYLSILFGILLIVISFLGKQIIRKRETEMEFTSLQKKLKEGKMNCRDHYSLGVIYLSKKLFDQSIIQLVLHTSKQTNLILQSITIKNLLRYYRVI